MQVENVLFTVAVIGIYVTAPKAIGTHGVQLAGNKGKLAGVGNGVDFFVYGF